jgi:hypothetical protein
MPHFDAASRPANCFDNPFRCVCAHNLCEIAGQARNDGNNVIIYVGLTYILMANQQSIAKYQKKLI